MAEFRHMAVILAVCSALALSACGGGNGEYAADEDDLRNPRDLRDYDPDDTILGFLGAETADDIINGSPGGDQLPVNRFLWRASLDTLSFLPLSSTDPFSGVIATDWSATSEQPTERVKVTAFVTDARLSAEALKVAVYRETRDLSGSWVAAPVNPQTARQLEDAILTRARQLRVADEEAG